MRLDKFLAERFSSRTKAARAIGKGLVTVNGKVASAATEVFGNEDIRVEEENAFVSEGGAKQIGRAHV